MVEPVLLTIPEACDALSIGRSKLYEFIAAGKLSVRKCGRKSLIFRSEIDEFAKRLPVVPRRTAR